MVRNQRGLFVHGDSRPVIDVLLATYRAEPNMLADQIRSIDAQRDVVVNLISSEDVNGVGACANFSALLEKSTARYTAFADQDDVWNEDKLVKSLEKLKDWSVFTVKMLHCLFLQMLKL